MGWVLGLGNGVVFRTGSSQSWSSYWTTHLFDEPDLNCRISSRSGLNLVDDFGNNASLLLPAFKSSNSNSVFLNGAKTRTQEHIFDGNDYTIYFKYKYAVVSRRVFCFGSSATGRGIEVRLSNFGMVYVYFGDGIVTRLNNFHNPITTTGWNEVLITINAATKELTSSVFHAGGTSTLTKSFADFTLNTNDNESAYTTAYADQSLAEIKKFAGIKTIEQCRDIDYITGLQLYYPDVVTGTDVSGNNLHLSPANVSVADKEYTTGGSVYLLEKGYDSYVYSEVIGFCVPKDINGNSVTGRNTYQNYIRYKSHDGDSTKHNLADSYIIYAQDLMDRSNATIYEDEARLNYYLTETPKAFHINEHNRLILNDYYKADYKGLFFPKITNNSYNDRQIVDEIFIYGTNKTGLDLNKVLLYTGDSDILSMIYLKNPYTDVPIITAITDSEFRIKINDEITYGFSDLKLLTDKIRTIHPLEDFNSKMARWIITNTYYASILSDYQDAFNVTNEDAKYLRLPYLSYNCYPGGRCAELSQFALGVFANYSQPNNQVYRLGGTGHSVLGIDAYMDFLYNFFIYKDRYVFASVEDVSADSYLVSEPIKKYTKLFRALGSTTEYNLTHWNEIINGTTPADLSDYPSLPTLSMKLPAGGSLMLPLKTTNTPQNYNGDNLSIFSQAEVVIPSGTIGTVDMPFFLLQITGTGSVVVDGITYSLPTDEAALKLILQSYAKFYHAFDIATNTDGITAEYLVNSRFQLYKNNQYSLTTISGSVAVSKTATTKIKAVGILSVATNDFDLSWSINHHKYFLSGYSFLVPVHPETADHRMICFYKTGLRPQFQAVLNHVLDDAIITAGTHVYDQCYASILTPKQITFTGTLELSFTSLDDSDTYYTLDGSTPDATKTLYEAPFTISATTTVKWINIKTDYANSHVNTRVITKT